jgi:hypothetical protein
MKQANAFIRIKRAIVLTLLLGSMLVAGQAALPVYAHGDETGAMEMGGEGGLQVTVDGRTLPSPASQSSDLSEIRVSVREVAEALGLQVKWNAKYRAVLIGDDRIPASLSMGGSVSMMDHSMPAAAGSAMSAMHVSAIVFDGVELPPAIDPMMMNKTVMVVADELAKALGIHYTFNAAMHTIELVTQEAEQQFAGEEQQVRDVLEGRGMTPQIAEDGAKEFTLTAELHNWSPLKGVMTTAWTFNGQAPAPTIRVTEGDHLRIKFVNNLPEPSTVHWHGVLVPNEMDGVPNLTQEAVQPGGTFVYDFVASHQGTFIYHSHYDDMTQVGNGMYGAFIIDPKPSASSDAANPSGDLTVASRFDHDYTMLLSGFHVNTTGGEEDYFTINGRSYPDTPPIEMKLGETARIRLINIDTMEVHTMHLHGMDFQIIARNGSPAKSVETANTVLLGPGETVDIAFRATQLGDWMFHCHILDHTMNGEQMSSGEMGGLITLINVTK